MHSDTLTPIWSVRTGLSRKTTRKKAERFLKGLCATESTQHLKRLRIPCFI